MSNVKPKPIIIVQGAQWGSEAKGAVAAFLAKERKVDWAVRTGAVNAGHTVYWGHHPIKMQQIPTGWIMPRTKLILGAGTYVHPEILADEIETISRLTGSDVRERLYVDHRVSLHLPEHTQQAKLENRHHSIGATGKGCSVAITDKIRYRGKGYKLFKQWFADAVAEDGGPWDSNLVGIKFVDTVEMLHDAYDRGEQISLEGTQGSLLDLNLGPYPYTTHKPTQAINWALEAGLPLSFLYEVVMVARTYPIRVAGNSGPMPKETTWPNIARDINRRLMLRRLGQRVKSYAIEEFEQALHETAHSAEWVHRLPKHMDGGVNYDFHRWSAGERVKYQVALSELTTEAIHKISLSATEELGHLFELTTVTKKLRRVSNWDGPSVAWSCKINRGAYIVLTFFNYLHPELWDHTGIGWNAEYERTCYQIEKDAGIPVRYVSVGPETEHIIRVDKLREAWRVQGQ